MPTIATFGAASARGFGTATSSGGPFFYQSVANSGSNVASYDTSAGSSVVGNLTYFGFGVGSSSNTVSFTSLTFNGTAGSLSTGTDDNTGSFNVTLGFGVKNVTSATYVQTIVLNGSGALSKGYGYVRIIGGNAPPTIFYNNVVPHATYPYTYNIANCVVGDIVILVMGFHGTAGSSTATNMALLQSSSYNGTNGTMISYGATVAANGTFTTVIDPVTNNTQWCHGIIVFRGN